MVHSSTDHEIQVRLTIQKLLSDGEIYTHLAYGNIGDRNKISLRRCQILTTNSIECHHGGSNTYHTDEQGPDLYANEYYSTAIHLKRFRLLISKFRSV